MLGTEHPNTLRTRNNLAIVYQDAERAEDAIAILEPLVADLERDPRRRASRHRRRRGNLANAYAAAGRGDDAERVRGQAADWGAGPAAPPKPGPALFDVD